MTSSSELMRPTGLHAQLAELLRDARERTLLLVQPLGDDDLRRQHDPLQGPILWDLGHIAHFEDLWLTRNLNGAIKFVEMPGLYNPLEYPRRTRDALPLPDKAAMLQLLADKREETLARLAQVDFEAAGSLLRDGFVYRLVAQHEYQHGETMLQTLQLKQGEPYSPVVRLRTPDAPTRESHPDEVVVAGGIYEIGTDAVHESYDNERPRHAVTLPSFAIETTPVTNGRFLEFMDDGGYRRAEFWGDGGEAWRVEEQVTAPRYWERRDGRWYTRAMDQVHPVRADHPVIHVSYWEAEAFANWAGMRLPSEAEWEVACTCDPASGQKSRFPWGDAPADPSKANIDQLTFDTAPVWSYGDNVSPVGCYGMIGDVWEWTATDFTSYPGFNAFPYPEYSEAFFGTEYKVLRGGSWATRPGAIRGTFRNWDYPQRRQIFSGFRCARDA